MNRHYLALILTLGFSSPIALSDHHNETVRFGDEEPLKVAKATTAILIDGKMEESAWLNTETKAFDHFYNIKQPTDKQSTRYRMLWDEENLYVFFECEDQYITAREKNRDGAPYVDDCAEIFLIPAPAPLNMHIGFEVNLFKASNDFVFFNDFYEGKNSILKSYNPDFEVEITYQGTINNNSDVDSGWTMEMAIPLKLFGKLALQVPVKPGNQWAFLAVRQDRNDIDGNRRSTSTLFPIHDIKKNVHRPKTFGLMEFVE